jgi:hypothetical protein
VLKKSLCEGSLRATGVYFMAEDGCVEHQEQLLKECYECLGIQDRAFVKECREEVLGMLKKAFKAMNGKVREYICSNQK